MNVVKQTSGGSDEVPVLRVLCVDDNRDVADSTADMLRLVGFEARACYSAKDAIVQVTTFLPGICLIDLNMPEMNGDELAVLLRQKSDALQPILVAMTAMSNEESCRRIENAGFDLHLVKPVDPHMLLLIVNRLWHQGQRRLSKAQESSKDHLDDMARSNGS